MHKLRNKSHIDILNSMTNIVPKGCSKPLSKSIMRKMLVRFSWDKYKVLEFINSGEYVYSFIND